MEGVIVPIYMGDDINLKKNTTKSNFNMSDYFKVHDWNYNILDNSP